VLFRRDSAVVLPLPGRAATSPHLTKKNRLNQMFFQLCGKSPRAILPRAAGHAALAVLDAALVRA
jgi:hypothetical protein